MTLRHRNHAVAHQSHDNKSKPPSLAQPGSVGAAKERNTKSVAANYWDGDVLVRFCGARPVSRTESFLLPDTFNSLYSPRPRAPATVVIAACDPVRLGVRDGRPNVVHLVMSGRPELHTYQNLQNYSNQPLYRLELIRSLEGIGGGTLSAQRKRVTSCTNTSSHSLLCVRPRL